MLDCGGVLFGAAALPSALCSLRRCPKATSAALTGTYVTSQKYRKDRRLHVRVRLSQFIIELLDGAVHDPFR